MGNFVSLTSEENKIKLQNLYYSGVFIGFTWILFHFTIIFFFGLMLKSILLVGVFLGLGNFIALLLDIPIGILQKHIKPKIFLAIGVIFMMIVCGIFIKFVYFYGDLALQIEDDAEGIVENIFNYAGAFLSSGLNIVLLLVAGMMYGVIKESLDVTIISYIFNNSSPSEYAQILSKYNIFNGGGAMLGLVLSGILLALNMKIAMIIFLVIICVFLLFVLKFFDNKADTVDFLAVKNIQLDEMKTNLLETKDAVISKINTKNLIELSRQSKVILLKPIEFKKKINFGDIYNETIKKFNDFYQILFGNPKNVVILWFLALIMQFGFWDAFVATFLADFFEKVIAVNQDELVIKLSKGLITGYVLLGLLVIPAFGFQGPFIKLSQKIGVFRVAMFGNLLSAISMICFGFASSMGMVMLFGILNSVGYAAVMPLAQGTFSGIYNQEYAKKFKLKEIDTTVSAAPLKIVINATNVLGIMFGSLIVKILGFNTFFVIFGVLLSSFFVWSFIKVRATFKNIDKEKKDSGADFA